MSLRPILLGLLEEPASGYDLKQAFEESIRHFWRAELSQIYPMLHRLDRDGLVSTSTEHSPKGPDRKVYSRTARGTAELHRWLLKGPELETDRFPWLGQLFFLGQVDDPKTTVRFLRELRAHFQRRLELLRGIEDYHRRRIPGFPDQLDRSSIHPYLTLLCGMRRTDATVAWCDECLALLNHE